MKRTDLHEYQNYCVEFLKEHPQAMLILQMGLGKSVISLTAILDLMFDSFDVGKTLVIAPLRVARNVWPEERDSWEHASFLKMSVMTGGAKQRETALNASADVYVINRENVKWLVDHLEKRRIPWPFDMVVIDELSSFKNHQSQRWKALRKVRPKIKRMVGLTGTPAGNGLMDLWAETYLIDGGERLGRTIGEYRRRWFAPGAGSGHVVYEWKPLRGADEEICKAIADICVSMKAEDYISLPPVLYNTVKVKLGTKAMAAYKQLEKDYVLGLADKEITATSAATLSGKLLQMANGAVYDEEGQFTELHTAKLEALSEMLEISEHSNYLVFYWFKHDLERLQKMFPRARKLDTAEDIRDWNAGRVRLLLAHPASAGHGLNLQRGGSVIVWYSLTWSLELYQQANKRLHRSGQKNTVVIHHLVATGTIDEDVMKALSCKRAGQDAVLEAVKARIAEYENRYECHYSGVSIVNDYKSKCALIEAPTGYNSSSSSDKKLTYIDFMVVVISIFVTNVFINYFLSK